MKHLPPLRMLARILYKYLAHFFASNTLHKATVPLFVLLGLGVLGYGLGGKAVEAPLVHLPVGTPLGGPFLVGVNLDLSLVLAHGLA